MASAGRHNDERGGQPRSPRNSNVPYPEPSGFSSFSSSALLGSLPTVENHQVPTTTSRPTIDQSLSLLQVSSSSARVNPSRETASSNIGTSLLPSSVGASRFEHASIHVFDHPLPDHWLDMVRMQPRTLTSANYTGYDCRQRRHLSEQPRELQSSSRTANASREK